LDSTPSPMHTKLEKKQVMNSVVLKVMILIQCLKSFLSGLNNTSYHQIKDAKYPSKEEEKCIKEFF